MPRYDLDQLGDEEFENLFQALLKEIIGAGTITFGSGPDGAREATFEGRAPYPSTTEQWEGSWIFQAKFHDVGLLTPDRAREAVLRDLKSELYKITVKYDYSCDNYILATNVKLTSVYKTGTIDRIAKAIDEFAEQYPEAKIPNIRVWGGDEVAAHLDQYPDIRRTYRHLVTPGDVLTNLLRQPRLLIAAMVIIAVIAAGAVFSKDTIVAWLSPPEPVPMTRLFNIAIADFGEVGGPGAAPVRESEDGRWLADTVFEKLHTRLAGIPELAGDVEIQHENIGIVRGDTPESRQQVVAELARQINADVFIYGHLVVGPPATIVPEFYVSPRLSGAEETTGADAFGSPMGVRLPLADDPVNRAKLKDEFIPRLEALSASMFGLAFFKADEPDLALQQLELARQVPQWHDDRGQGKEILYLWTGSTLNKRALQGSETETSSCPIPEYEESDDWECARRALEWSLDLNPRFARAYIGLGKLWFDQAEQTRGGQTFYVCDFYERAVEEYEQALDPAMEATKTAHVDAKAYYNIGLAYGAAYQHGCGEHFYSPSIENLTSAVAVYERSPNVLLVREIGSKAFYQLGLVHLRAGKYDLAVPALKQAIAVSEPEDIYEEDWQAIRWYAYNQIGHAYSALAQAGDEARWQDAIESYGKVVARYEEGKFADDVVMSIVFHQLGVAYSQTGQYVQALQALRTSITIAEIADVTEAQSWRSLRWESYLQLGNAFSALAERGDATRWAEALDAYEEVTAEFELSAEEVSGTVAAEAYYRTGVAFEALHRPDEASASYEKAVATGGVAPRIEDMARERLQTLDGQ